MLKRWNDGSQLHLPESTRPIFELSGGHQFICSSSDSSWDPGTSSTRNTTSTCPWEPLQTRVKSRASQEFSVTWRSHEASCDFQVEHETWVPWWSMRLAHMVKTFGCSTCIYIYIYTHAFTYTPRYYGTAGRLYPLIFPSYFLPFMGETSRNQVGRFSQCFAEVCGGPVWPQSAEIEFKHWIIIWLVVWNLAAIFPYIGNMFIPTDEIHHFSEGWLNQLNHQPLYIYGIHGTYGTHIPNSKRMIFLYPICTSKDPIQTLYSDASFFVPM